MYVGVHVNMCVGIIVKPLSTSEGQWSSVQVLYLFPIDSREILQEHHHGCKRLVTYLKLGVSLYILSSICIVHSSIATD